MVLWRFGSNCWSGCAAPITIATSAVSQPVYPFSFQTVSASSCITVGELGWHNPYAYANGDPVNLVDPSGMIAERPEMWSGCKSSPSKKLPLPLTNAIYWESKNDPSQVQPQIGWGGFDDDFSDSPCLTILTSTSSLKHDGDLIK